MSDRKYTKSFGEFRYVMISFEANNNGTDRIITFYKETDFIPELSKSKKIAAHVKKRVNEGKFLILDLKKMKAIKTTKFTNKAKNPPKDWDYAAGWVEHWSHSCREDESWQIWYQPPDKLRNK